MPEVKPFAVNPIEAIDFLRAKINLPTRTWTDLWQGMHARAFVVAGANSEKLVADFRNAVEKALEQGTTLETFRKDFDAIVAKHGWSYNGSRGWRSALIYDTNIRMANAAGRWEQIQRVKKFRPYIRYVALLDDVTRPEHRAWHDTILPVDHIFWKTHFPLNGYHCRCTVQSLNDRDLKRFGLKVSKKAPPTPKVTRTINTPDGPINVEVPDGIDPSFDYNVGEAGFGRGAQARALETHGAWKALEAPGQTRVALDPLPLDRSTAKTIDSIEPGNEAGYRAALRDAFDGADDVILADPTGARVQLTQGIVDHMMSDASRQDGRERYFPLLRELVEEPAEIWIGWARSDKSGRVALRRRYVKLIEIGAGRTIGLIADADGSVWSGFTLFRSRKSGGAKLRSGLRIFKR